MAARRKQAGKRLVWSARTCTHTQAVAQCEKQQTPHTPTHRSCGTAQDRLKGTDSHLTEHGDSRGRDTAKKQPHTQSIVSSGLRTQSTQSLRLLGAIVKHHYDQTDVSVYHRIEHRNFGPLNFFLAIQSRPFQPHAVQLQTARLSVAAPTSVQRTNSNRLPPAPPLSRLGFALLVHTWS